MLAYLARYTHRVAISNRRLIRADADSVTFTVKNYRVEGPGRYTTMTLATHEFIRRFLIHVLPKGLHRIRHYGLLAGPARAGNLARMRELLAVPAPAAAKAEAQAPDQPAVGDGDTVSVAGEVRQHRLGPGERSLAVDEPFCPAQRFKDGGEGPGIGEAGQGAEEGELARRMRRLELLQHQPPEQLRQHPDGQEETGPAGDPALAV